ncbi:NAD-dependent epimerase/dehydratase [Halothece sp. PCC 7418]|uniref:SDR family oxidoreductase n=1 Tax=Halothece sp. (strain PCC 7418) TaxID=65093 RepID=UPI0002A07959|nr:SDR family oxidoreductase [Halothece sp. PCC 7418]AFZ43751.1 NAD-dependent epimerase/dehydratase [Halothece sp. PCC 7418]
MTNTNVLVTGATGRTGSIVLKKLRQNPDLNAFGFARSEAKIKEIFGSSEGVYIGDIRDKNSLEPAIQNCHVLIIVTSAVPQMKEPPKEGERPEFMYPEDATPEIIDYQGQVNQIDLAQEAGVDHIILMGSMGGTNENHPLNKLGNGNILIWKRTAEEYLIDSGIDYTIVRAGGLINEPGGQRKLLVGKHDTLLNRESPTIPREDVAELIVQALMIPEARNKAFDVVSEAASPEEVTTDFTALFTQTTPGL